MVTFSDDELPVESTKHNRALYLTIKCEDFVVSKVLVDNGSSANIFPLSTLNKLKVDDERIHKNSTCIRGFDGGGCPWIHAAKAVPSTLHQMVKFEWDRQEIVVHGEDNLCAHSDASLPFIEAEDDKGPWVYQVFETVPIEKVSEGKCVPTPKITSTPIMMAFEMLKNGFVPGKGLGASLQGIIQPMSLPENLGTLGLGFKPTAADVKRALNTRRGHFQSPLRVSPAFPPVKQKLREFKTDMSVKIKEEVIKQIDTKVIRVTRYPMWLANVVPVPKKDGKTRVCVDYRDLNKASPKDNFPLSNIHILIDNCAKHEIGFFVDCYAGYHQILMDEADVEKTAFITPWGTYYYRVMTVGLKNIRATYMREMTTIFHDMIHKEIEVYVDDVIIKSRK
ncbi:uncharacterized protein [Nicotiana sylvestris]|uniref:uncharacterized protein n=1 Tax=Nicotiana sylvestris TaxID=4096 RepID=UPI00388C7F31